ncbi:MAG: AAA family ATPase [Bryobacteraceae bacterium]
MQSQRSRIDGWKEISAKLGVSERTARRYERQEDLPVHRHMHESGGTVYAWSDQLESWKQSRTTAARPALPGHSPGDSHRSRTEELAHLERSPLKNIAAALQTRDAQDPPLIGRDQERDQVLRAVDRARSGHGSVVLIGGEPGIGKSHLVRLTLSEATRRGCVGLVGHCRDMEGAPPYVPFVEMLECLLRFTPRDAFRKLLGDSAAEGARLMPELRQAFADIPAPVELPPEQQRRFLFNACRDFVERAANLNPIVAVFEDLHWADEATLLLFSHLAQSVCSIPLLLVGTYRNAEIDISPPMARLLESCVRDKSAMRFVLGRLAEPGVGALLDQLSRQTTPARIVSFVFDKTEGNPFFVEELFLELKAEGRLFDENGSWRNVLQSEGLSVPNGVRLVIGRRLDRLKEHTRQVLRVAAIVGRSFSVGVLEALEGAEDGRDFPPSAHPDRVLEALEEAERAQLIGADQTGREPGYRFVHELVRQTLVESLSLPRRQRLHAQVANAIERLSVGTIENQASVLAHHYYQAGSTVDVGHTIAYFVMAARSATASAAHEDALAHVERALDLAQRERQPNIADLVASRAAALRSLSRPREAIAAYEQAIEMFSAGGRPLEAAEASQTLGHIHLWRADPGRACAVLDRAVKAVGMQAPLARYQLGLLNALSLGVNGEMEAAFAALAEAKQMESALPDLSSDAVGYARLCEGHICYFAARPKGAAESARAAVTAFRLSGNLWAEVEAYEVMSEGMWAVRPEEETETALAGLLARSERVGHQNAVWTYRFMSAELLMHRGELEQAETAAREMHDFATATSAPWSFLDHVLLAAIAHYRGDLAQAARWSRSGLAAEPESYMSGQLSGCLFWNLAAKRDPEAEHALAAAREHLPVPGQIPTIGSSSCLAFVAEGLGILGRMEEAAALEARAEWVVANAPPWLYTRHLFRTSAGIAAASAGNWARSEEHHRTAVQIADSTQCRVAQPIVRYWHADMLCSRDMPGDRQRARELFSDSLQLADAMGMVWHARRAADRLALLLNHQR